MTNNDPIQSKASAAMTASEIPYSHPRYQSLQWRETIVAGMRAGIASEHGLIAHGRGEAYDYILGERTHPFAVEAIEAAAAMLLQAQRPVISINGNAAALVPKALVTLHRRLNAPLEVNIFHSSAQREQAILEHFLQHGASKVLMPCRDCTLGSIESNRRYVNPNGLYQADVVFVPLEDGDRCIAMERMNKRVITVDLNPLSRTAQTASVTIVDHVARCLPILIDRINALYQCADAIERIIRDYDNPRALQLAEAAIRGAACDV